MSADNQVGRGGPLHAHHTDVQMFRGVTEGSVNFGHEVNKRWMAHRVNVASVPNYRLRKGVAF